jgi:hypothetical protein
MLTARRCDVRQMCQSYVDGNILFILDCCLDVAAALSVEEGWWLSASQPIG